MDLKIEIFREIYQYSIAKQMKRIERWWDGLVHLCQKLVRKRGRDGLTDTETKLMKLLTLLSVVCKLSNRHCEQQLNEGEWKAVYEWSAVATELASEILGAKAVPSCEMLTTEFGGMYQLLSI